MDDEQKAWYRQFSSSFGSREYVRFAAATCIWMLLGVGVSIWLGGSWVVSAVFTVALFVFPVLGPRWRPSYRLLRFIFGNKDMPPEPMPRAKFRSAPLPRPWWSLVPGLSARRARDISCPYKCRR